MPADGSSNRTGMMPVPRKYACEGICDFLRGIEGREHGAFQRIDITLVLRLVTAVLTDKAVEFRRGSKEFEVGFRPVDGIRQFLGGIQDALQSSEAAVPTQYVALGLGRGAPFPVKEECRPYLPRCCPSVCCLRLNLPYSAR